MADRKLDLGALLPLIVAFFGDREVTIGDRRVRIAPVLTELIEALADGKISNDEVIDLVTAALKALSGATKVDKPEEPEVKPPTKPPVVTPPVDPGEPDVDEGAPITSLRVRIRNIEGDRHGADAPRPGIEGAQRDWRERALQVEERIKFDVSPYDSEGNEVRTGDVRLPPARKDVDELSPLRYEWEVRGKDGVWVAQQNTPGDLFDLESYARNYEDSYTPVLKQTRVAGPGTSEARLRAFYPAGTVIGGRALRAPMYSAWSESFQID